jgi:ECF sigma factor
MGNVMANDPSESQRIIERLRAGDDRALTDLFQHYRDRLRRMVELRLDTRLQGRVDASWTSRAGWMPTFGAQSYRRSSGCG